MLDILLLAQHRNLHAASPKCQLRCHSESFPAAAHPLALSKLARAQLNPISKQLLLQPQTAGMLLLLLLLLPLCCFTAAMFGNNSQLRLLLSWGDGHVLEQLALVPALPPAVDAGVEGLQQQQQQRNSNSVATY
jgi:hypothetical protein